MAADNGSLTFWDYNTGTPFQNMEDIPQPGSLEAEAGVFCSTFDRTGTRLITGGADKTIKVWSTTASLFRNYVLILALSFADIRRAEGMIAYRPEICCYMSACTPACVSISCIAGALDHDIGNFATSIQEA